MTDRFFPRGLLGDFFQWQGNFDEVFERNLSLQWNPQFGALVSFALVAILWVA